MQTEEIFPLVDEIGNVVGKASRKECHSGSKLLHPVVHLQLFNSKGELYLQKRSEKKDIQPGKWDTAVGGHIDYGESVEEALMRESREELGIEGFIPELLFRYIFESEIEREMVNTYRTVFDGKICPDQDEIVKGRYWKITEIENYLGKGIFTPNFENEFRMMKNIL
ncbi:NUDIX hydrolase [Coprobacter tertius]|uniref:NUDIX domain-containing protein n=1 Tax=Coprobacter tertius TaxID=2944915 RepID=A0ABT1ME30_9BACT|nr:NUDIX domain-containing protein [Coprobacter tertius]MCP9610888.1 NUDIX domain-containing protein [Coprobacter tertius]